MPDKTSRPSGTSELLKGSVSGGLSNRSFPYHMSHLSFRHRRQTRAFKTHYAGAEMPDVKLSILFLGLTLLLLGPACQAHSLGLTVHVVPLESDGGNTVRAYFSAIAPTPCPSLSELCAVGEDCLVHATSVPFNGTKPGPGWCVRQWQKTVPSNYEATITLGSQTEMFVAIKAAPKVRENSGRLNTPAFVAPFPPLRARVDCPHHFHLSVKDLDGDRARCRFALPDQGECVNCTRHSFMELDEERCMLLFTGKASAGQYFIFLMVEDLIPVPKMSPATDNTPLSSVPVHLSLTVEESTTSCSDEPLATGETPKEDTTLFVLPYQQVQFNIDFTSDLESALEVAVVGPPELYRVGFKSLGPLASMTMAWVRAENTLARLLPICFAVNTNSLQSEPRCVWLYQREMMTLPEGTELTCVNTEMTLVLPVSSLTNINLAELQLNSPNCPVSYNDTHLTAVISLNGCGTKAVQSGNELVYTNTLQSVRPYTVVSRQPSLILPLACRIPGAQVKGPHYQVGMPTEEETFGELRVWIELHLPGDGPLSKFTRDAILRSHYMDRGRVRRADSPLESKSNTTRETNITSGAVGSRISQLDLHLLSNSSIEKAEMIVSNCLESETEDFSVTFPLLEQGCTFSSTTLEVVTTQTYSKVYRLDLSALKAQGSTMYVRCTVNLCLATGNGKCPDLCARSFDQKTLVGSVLTRSYTVSSGPVSLVVTTPAPTTEAGTTTTAAKTAAATTTTTAAASATTTAAATNSGGGNGNGDGSGAGATTITAVQNTTSHAPEPASAMAAGMILTTISLVLQII